MSKPITVRDPLLAHLTLTTRDEQRFPDLRTEPLPGSRYSPAGILTTYIANVAFNVQRFPGFPERLFTAQKQQGAYQGLAQSQARVAEWLTQPGSLAQVHAAAADLQRINQEIMAWYAAKGVHSLRLYRSVGWLMVDDRSADYISAIQEALRQAQDRQEPFRIETDTLTHWGTQGEYAFGESSIELSLNIPTERILMCGPLMDGMEPQEYLILNPDPTGTQAFRPEEVTVRRISPSHLKPVVHVMPLHKREHYNLDLMPHITVYPNDPSQMDPKEYLRAVIPKLKERLDSWLNRRR